jgi:short-subunit dehydrogenase
MIRTVVITGSSTGLGAALALSYADGDRNLGLLARDRNRLERVSVSCQERGARVEIGTPDVTDYLALRRWMQDFNARHPIDLLIVNAGVFTGNGANGDAETVDEIDWLVRTNLDGAMMTIAAALPLMRARKSGRIAIIGSLAAFQPLADAPAYSASKAGVMSYGEALREWLLPDNVDVSLIYPGHMRTQQVAHHVGSLPLIMSADKAAAKIKRGLDRGRSFIAFPKRLLWLIRAGRLLPWRLRAQLGGTLRFHVSKSSGEVSNRFSLNVRPCLASFVSDAIWRHHSTCAHGTSRHSLRCGISCAFWVPLPRPGRRRSGRS